jgi:hypothetical protein
MGALHQIESTQGSALGEKGTVALDAVRSALASLQTQPGSATADKATEVIAGSLGLVHGLAEKAKALAQPVIQASRNSSAPAAFDRTQLASDPAPAAPSGALDATLPTPTRPEAMSAPNISLESTQASVRSPVASIPFNPGHSSQAAEPARNSKIAAPPPGGAPDGAIQVEANLGAHSPTNFYKGLSGNDVVDDGGLFVATYDIPNLGSKLYVSVHMPGGYEFQAVAEVRWVRETGAGDAPPGFGCALRDVTKEARQLIYRYVRNREPLFHDDL